MAEEKGAVRVVLLHSNDIHSRLEQSAKIATFIAEQRAAYGSDGVLLLDIGDHLDRMRFETEGSGGRCNIALMNEARYDAGTLGNNEGICYTFEQLDAIYRHEARFPIVCANLLLAETGERPEWMAPSLIVKKNGLRVGLIGATAPFAEFYLLMGWQATEPKAAIAEQVAIIRPHVDVLIVMSHLGLPTDRELAAAVPGIDLILGAHTHHLLEEPLVIAGTAICAAGKFGDYLGRVEISYDQQSRQLNIAGSCVPVAAYAEHPDADSIIRHYHDLSEQALGRSIAWLEQPLPADTGRESPLCNLLAAGLRRWTAAEIGLVNAGQLLGGLAKGDVTAGQLHALCPSPINPCRMRLTGRQLREALEQSLLPSYIDKPIRGFGFRGEVLGTLCVDGLEIDYREQLDGTHKIEAIRVNGSALVEERAYTVGTIDMFTFGCGYEGLKLGRDFQYFMPEFIRDVLAAQLRDRAAVEACFIPRWLMVDNYS